MAKKIFGASLIAILALALAIPTLAAVDVSAEGEVTAIDLVAGTFAIQAGVDAYSVIPPVGFDLNTLTIGDNVLVEGSLEAGVITATSVEILPAAVDVEVYGEVTHIDEVVGDLQILTTEDEVFTVVPPEGFDLTTLAVGNFVFVGGTLEDSTIMAAELLILAEVEITGEVVGINEAEGNLQVETEGDMTFLVWSPDGFDPASLEVGDMVVVNGFQHDEVIFATSIEILPEKGESPPNEGFYCSNPDARHPALNALAMAYGAEYGQLLNYFCIGHFGVGEIMLALQAAALVNNGMDAGDILALKAELGGWGQVWQEFGLKGRK